MTDPTREAVARALFEKHNEGSVWVPQSIVSRHYRDLADAAIAALRPAQDAEGWRDIASAPKDGTRILIDFGPCGVHAVAWEEALSGIATWCVDDCKHGPYALRGYVEKDVQGWQSLPASPPRTLEGKPTDDRPGGFDGPTGAD